VAGGRITGKNRQSLPDQRRLAAQRRCYSLVAVQEQETAYSVLALA
jgi:hypothetical protein